MHIPLLATAYLPPVSWCAVAWHAPAVALEACEHYQKGSLRNRCYIAGPNGVQRLSIPLQQGKHQQLPIREVRIAYDEPWQRQHWRSIRTAYGNAPFFEHYAEELERLFTTRFELLYDHNLAWLEWIFQKKWCWSGQFSPTSTYSPPDASRQRWDYRNVFSVREISAEEKYSLVAPYPQVFMERTGFLPDLSVLDLLLCCGKQAPGYLLTR